MLQTVEIFPSARQSIRRAVRCDVDLIAEPWESPRLHRVTDLSPDGMRVAAGTCLGLDERLVVSFTLPGWWLLGELTLFARVVRRSRRRGSRPATMGLRFLDLQRGARDQLRATLRGVPPPLPRFRLPNRKEDIWIEQLPD